jgi:hypothetical protein
MPMYSVPSANDGSKIRDLVDYLGRRVGSAPPPAQIDPQLDMDVIASPAAPKRTAVDERPGGAPLLRAAPGQAMASAPDEFSSSDFRARRPAAKTPSRKPSGRVYGLD